MFRSESGKSEYSGNKFVSNAQCSFQMAVVQALWAFQLMISTALLAKILTTYGTDISPGLSNCDSWDKTPDRKYKYTCGQLTGGVVSMYII